MAFLFTLGYNQQKRVFSKWRGWVSGPLVLFAPNHACLLTAAPVCWKDHRTFMDLMPRATLCAVLALSNSEGEWLAIATSGPKQLQPVFVDKVLFAL